MVLQTAIPGLPRVATGKVRDVYAVGSDRILLVATDRISAFDMVLNQGIPGKGAVLTQLSRFWFDKLAAVVPHHLLSTDDATVFAALATVGVVVDGDLRRILSNRCMLCRRAKPLPIEAVVRGYLSGSAWNTYRDRAVGCPPPTPAGTLWVGRPSSARVGGQSGGQLVDLWGVAVPDGLRESDKLPAPIFTPSTKATAGHDEPMPQNEIASYIGSYAEPVRNAAIALYNAAHDYAAGRGILLADTKFEFGTSDTGELLLIDEVLTPDSSRFWSRADYEPGRGQASWDKQFVRDYLLSVPGWNRQAPAPALPPDIVTKTADKYREAFRLLTGRDL